SLSPEPLRPMLHDYVTGQRARALGDQAAARSALHRAAAHPMASLPIVMEWGRAELDANDFAMADSAFRRATRLGPYSAAAWLGLGTALRGHNSLDAACASFARAVELAPRDSIAQFDLAGASLAAAERAGQSARGTRLRREAEAAFSACIAADYRVPEC